MAAAAKHLPAKRSSKGLGQDRMVESFIMLSALGGDCLDDFDHLRQDAGLAAMLGYPLPAAATARQWLDRFHDAALLADRPAQGSFIPTESRWLTALGAVRDHSIRSYVSALQPGPAVTFDVDAHLVGSSKAEVRMTYEGYRGYEPLLVCWAEQHLIVADQFRDGNVSPAVGIKELVDEAYASLPLREGGWQVAVRSDSAGYQYQALDHWQTQGWRFAVSATMSPPLRREVGGTRACNASTQHLTGCLNHPASYPSARWSNSEEASNSRRLTAPLLPH